MITHPNCKVNLGLHVLSRRPDGYHNIESIFLPVKDIYDVLEITPIDTAGEPHATFSTNDPLLQSDDNLCMRAYKLMRQQFPSQVGSVAIHLDKRIPYGAGIGGGSSDAAFTMKMITEMFSIDITDYELACLAAQVGADCPFFIYNHTAYVTGIGDMILPVDFDLEKHGLTIEIVKPEGVSISTREAYAGITPRDKRPELHTPNIANALLCPVEQWRELFVNDFEQSVVPNHPEIAALKQRFYDNGALYASMSGSGSAVFAINKRQR